MLTVVWTELMMVGRVGYGFMAVKTLAYLSKQQGHIPRGRLSPTQRHQTEKKNLLAFIFNC